MIVTIPTLYVRFDKLQVFTTLSINFHIVYIMYNIFNILNELIEKPSNYIRIIFILM